MFYSFKYDHFHPKGRNLIHILSHLLGPELMSFPPSNSWDFFFKVISSSSNFLPLLGKYHYTPVHWFSRCDPQTSRSSPLENLLEMKILRAHPRHPEWESLEILPRNLCFQSLLSDSDSEWFILQISFLCSFMLHDDQDLWLLSFE